MRIIAKNVMRVRDLNSITFEEFESTLEDRLKMLMIKRDFRFFDRYILKHVDEMEVKIYQLKAAAGMIYLQRDKIQQSIENWMRETGDFSEDEIKAWSHPRYEWKEVRITPEQDKVVQEWRKKYQIKDDTDWTQGIVLTDEDKKKLDKYKQIGILQPRQSGKSEVVVRVNIYSITIIHRFDTGVFAPTEKQAKEYIFQRTRDYIEDNPAYKGRFKRLNALDLTLDPETASGSSMIAASASPTANIEGDSLNVAIIDEAQDVTDFKIKKSIKYMMAAKSGAMIKIGTVNTVKGHFWESMTKKGSSFWYQVIIYPDIVAACRPDWAEFIANEIEENGRWADTVRMAVFLEWLLSLGMFISDEMWESMLDPAADWVEYDKDGIQYCLIDVAKTKDETIAMVIKLDTSRVINGRYAFKVLNTMALAGVDYDSQYEQIKAWIDQNYKVAAIGVDDTGGRGGIADRFEKTEYRVEKFNYSRPSKSEWYTNLSTIINAQYESHKKGLYHEKLISIPASENTRKSKSFRDFEEQMGELQREYVGKYLVVHHPDVDGARDDYPDTLMMAAWMASRVTVTPEELAEAIAQAPDTKMQDMDWQSDLWGGSGNSGGKQAVADRRAERAKRQKADDELDQILKGASDLDQPDW